MSSKKGKQETVVVRPLKIERMQIEVIGRTSLIVNNWSKKSLEDMKNKGKAADTKPRPPRDPEAAFNSSRYLLPDGSDGIPVDAFKAAIVDACRFFKNSKLTKVDLKQSILIHGEMEDSNTAPLEPRKLVRINGEPTMRTDAPRIGMGTTDLRWRAEFWPWSAVLDIEYMPDMIGASALVNIINAAGYGGVGEWRPSAPKSATGTHGMFEVKTDE